MKIWRADGLTQLHVYEAQSDSTQAVAVSPDDRHLAVGRMDGSLEIYPIQFSRNEKETVDVDSANDIGARVRKSGHGRERKTLIKYHQRSRCHLNGALPMIIT